MESSDRAPVRSSCDLKSFNLSNLQSSKSSVQSPHGKPAPAHSRPTEERSSNLAPILSALALVIVVVGIAAFLLRTDSKIANRPSPYAANIKFSDLKMSAAENFVGSTVTYLDGTVTNTGDKTVSHAMVNVSFKDSLGQVVQAEDVPLRILQTSGPYPEAVDLSVAPLAPAQANPSASPSNTSPPTGTMNIPSCR